MPTYRLHYFPESGNSYKFALMLTLCGQSFEPICTDFGGGVTRTAEWRQNVNRWVKSPCWKWMANASRITREQWAAVSG
jgi:glutathione S-transferase